MKTGNFFCIAVLLASCATVEEEKVAVDGYRFNTGKTQEQVVSAIVATMQEENLSISTLNEKFGIIATGLKEVPAATIAKWRGDSTFGLGSALWKVDIGFTVNAAGDVLIKYCVQGPDRWSGTLSCEPYKADVAAKFLGDRVLSKL